jgi:hypothetical protein
MRYSLWAAETVAGWIEEAQKFQTAPSRENTGRVIAECVGRLTGGDVIAFARLVGARVETVKGWQIGKQTPAMDHLLKIGYAIDASLVDMLTGRLFAQGEYIPDGLLSEKIRRSFGRPLPNTGDIRRVLEAALVEDPAPSLPELAERHGYKSVGPLRRVSAELCKKVTARWRRQGGPEKFQKLRDDETARRVLEQALEQEFPPRLAVVISDLGYKGSSSLRARFPELCKQITAKRALYLRKRASGWRNVLEAALRETPPPNLSVVVERLGEVEPERVRHYLPDLCRAISDRRARWKASLAGDTVSNLRAALEENPPLPLGRIAARHGYITRNLRDSHPELCRMIVERYAAHRRSCSEEKKQLFREAVRRAVLDLYARGVYPSYNKVKLLLGNAPTITPWKLSEPLRELRRELGLTDADSMPSSAC